MGDSEKSKEKSQYSQWGPEETNLLIDLLVDGIRRNWRDANDPAMKKFTAPDEAWDEYLLKHPNHTHLRYESNEQYEDLQLIFGCAIATGGFAIGMGDTTDARTFRGWESNRVIIDNVNLHQNNDEVFELSSQQPSASPEFGMSSFRGTSPKGLLGKLHPRKKSKTEGTSKKDEEDPMITVSSKILSVIQQREERLQREAEKREEKIKHEAE
ncbi:hypothetical protein V5N11_021351 [Cardamine amara subsp. amara]|uniref:Myb-like domain-containing protein n=1 Tax=Cardamine amara subsp. amara TaxID=228776 RepID=A0ABD1AEG7_CARAN